MNTANDRPVNDLTARHAPVVCNSRHPPHEKNQKRLAAVREQPRRYHTKNAHGNEIFAREMPTHITAGAGRQPQYNVKQRDVVVPTYLTAEATTIPVNRIVAWNCYVRCFRRAFLLLFGVTHLFT
jgi:hypothetical protein